jgi:methyl-accepting chemotaxis protein
MKLKIIGFRHWSVGRKITSIAIASVLPLALLIVAYIVPQIEQNLFSEKMKATSHVVDIAFNLMKEYDQRVQSGEFSIEEGQKRFKDRLRKMRYGNDEYFWINDLTPTMILHPFKPELEGKNLSGNKDPNGKQLFIEMVNVSKSSGGGVVEYMWAKPGEEKPVDKISVVKLFAPWGWIVGSGIYVDDVHKDVAGFKLSLFIGMTAAVLIAIGLGVFFGRMFRRSLQTIGDRMNNADLNTRFNSDQEDEIGALEKAFDRFVGEIKGTLIQVSEATAAVVSASTEISSSTDQMASGSQEQSSQTAEVAAAIEEMSKALEEGSGNIKKAAEGAERAKGNASAGGEVVCQTISGMKAITDVVHRTSEQIKVLGTSSDKIGEIIGVIDEIADQTNLLALNAAIEAARAGEQGRGFAVVADEVRKLAERTSRATKEIAVMIRQIQQDTGNAVLSMEQGTSKVDNGIELAEKAGEVLTGILRDSHEIAGMMEQISAASEQQTKAAEQISKNVEAINAITQDTSSSTQQIASATEDLQKLTENLQATVSRFNLHNRGTAPRDQAKGGSQFRSILENGHLVKKISGPKKIDRSIAQTA